MSNVKHINRVPVPKPELDLAIECIRNSISKMIDNYKIKHGIGSKKSKGNSTSSMKHGHDNDKEEVIISDSLSTLKEQIASSLITSIEKAVEPYDESEFKQRFIKFDTPMKQNIQKAIQNEDEMSCSSDDDSDGSNQSQEDHILDDDDEDEEDLIDQVALQRARELRKLVREKAMDVGKKKDMKISMLLDFITKQLHEWEHFELDTNENCNSDGEGGGISEDDDKTFELKAKHNKERLQKMSTSLSNLEKTLQSMEVKLPDTLESIQQSIDTIQRYIDKKEKTKNNGVASNHIERAILSRLDVNKPYPRQQEEALENDSKSSTMANNFGKVDIISKLNELDAQQRFSLFVSQVGR